MMKKVRHKAIVDIINKYNVETQEELANYLKDAGYVVTQATVSRDIRQLKLLKLTSGGVYKYVAPKNELENTTKYNHALFSSIIDIAYALNNVVIKTTPGLAQAVAAGIDSLNDSDVLGCVAGDDAIILVSKSEEASVRITEKISKIAEN